MPKPPSLITQPNQIQAPEVSGFANRSIEVSCPFEFIFPLPDRLALKIASSTEMVVVN